MKWFYCQKETFVPINNINPYRGTYYLGFSKIDLPTPDKDGNDMKFLLVRHDAPLHLDLIKPILLDLIKQYDKSDDINCVLIDNDKTWFDKNTRTDLINSLKTQKEIGKTDTVLWYKVGEELKSVNLTIDKCLEFLYKLVIYGDKTYNVTQNHIKAINELTTIDEIMSYNITENYPAYVKLITKSE